MNKQLSVMGLAARASMVPVLIAAGLTALAVGALTYLANPEHTGGAAGVGAAPLTAAVGYLMVMVMLCLGGCGFGSQTAYTVRRLRLREELVDLWWAAYHAAMLLVLWALVAYLVLYIAALVAWRYPVLLGMQLKLQGLEPNWGVGPQSLMLLVYSDSFLHHLLPLADAAVWVTDAALLMANALAAALFIRSQRRGRLTLCPVATTIVTLYTFTIWLSDGTWMICLLAALAMAGCTLTLLLTGGERREV